MSQLVKFYHQTFNQKKIIDVKLIMFWAEDWRSDHQRCIAAVSCDTFYI